ncbi:MAG TPA: metal-dependent transcriptional regulator [Anaerolineales bacterium]|nr:metal-dependent transcriptional regulator [Anaerolineales bacterium]
MPDALYALLAGTFVLIIAGVLLWPEVGLTWRWRRQRRITTRVLSEDALKFLHRAERNAQPATLQIVAGALQIPAQHAADLLSEMQARELVEWQGDQIQLTANGRQYALQIIRSHRLYERYLAEETGYSAEEWHELAEQQEHGLTPAEIDQLAARLGNPTHDPHGDPIPTANGQMVYPQRQLLNGLESGQVARIVHLEDEPECVYAQLIALGLHPGLRIEIIEKTPQRIRFWVNGDEQVLAPVLAASVAVTLLAPSQSMDKPVGLPLSSLKPGEHGKIVALSPGMRGAERRRLLDFGLLPGTLIQAELISPSGDPTAYRIRDALVALRTEQAGQIRIERLPEAVE